MQDEEMTTNMPPQEEGAEPSPEFVAEEAFLDARGAEIETLQAQIAELKNAVLRERADSDNLRKRFEREKESALKFGSEKLIKELLPVIDSLTLGLEAAKAHEAEGRQALDHFIEGSSMTLKLLLDVLQKNGVIPSPDAEPNTILHVAQKGYLLNGRVIRAAQVIVADGAQKNPPQA